MNILRPLSPHLPIYKPQLTSTFSISHIWKRWSIPFLFLTTLVLFFYLLCLKVGLMTSFQVLLSKAGSLLALRALSFILTKMGCSGGLAFSVYLICKMVIINTTEATPPLGNMMFPGGTDPGAYSSRTQDHAPLERGKRPLFEIPASSVSQDAIWNALEQQKVISGDWVTEREEKLEELILQLRHQEGMRKVAFYRLNRTIESLEEILGTEALDAMIDNLESLKRESPVYKLSKFITEQELRGVKEKDLKREFMGTS